MSMSLTSLPSELLSCVVANIASRSTLCSLARCSRQLHFCTIPHLYRHVTIREKIPRREQQDGRLKTLASLLIRRPDLAGLVRHFTLHVLGPSWRVVDQPEEFNEPAALEGRVSPELFKVDQAFATAATASILSIEEKINCLGQFSPTHKSYYDLILALLLPALLKVEKLVLDLDIEWDTYYFEQMIRRAACREKPFNIRPPFEALTIFFHPHHGSEAFIPRSNALTPRSTGFIASLLKLPAIQEISGSFEMPWDIEDDDPVPSDKDLEDLNSASSPVTSLDLAVYALSTVDLGHILRAPKALKTLAYMVCPPACINFTDVRHALASQENCLESLSLDYDAACDPDDEILGSMTSFISFNTLKVFKTAAFFLAVMDTDHGTERDRLIDIFPPSLETLYLSRFHPCFKGLLIALEHLLAQKSPQQIPSLKELILDETDSIDPMDDGPFRQRSGERLMDLLWNNTQETAIGRLRRLAAAQGVSVHLIEELADEESLVGLWEPPDVVDESTDGESTDEESFLRALEGSDGMEESTDDGSPVFSTNIINN
ncbi:hypothetical protein MMC22_005761 [Lobaria immixta]|nr:hypothetical protein [Lobaria immixta]